MDKNNGHLIGFGWFQVQCKDCSSSNNFRNYSPENSMIACYEGLLLHLDVMCLLNVMLFLTLCALHQLSG